MEKAVATDGIAGKTQAEWSLTIFSAATCIDMIGRHRSDDSQAATE